jgi:hypothetical protein
LEEGLKNTPKNIWGPPKKDFKGYFLGSSWKCTCWGCKLEASHRRPPLASITEIRGGGRWPEAVSKTASATLHVMTSARFDSRINIYVFLIFGRKVGAGPMKKASDAHVDGGSPRAE